MAAIRRPSVEIEQEFVTESTTVLEPMQAACIVGPCFRVISAFEDNGDAIAEAYAGTYRDGNGLIAYDVPSLGAEDDLTSLEDEMRVFLVVGSTTTELTPVASEVAILEDAEGDFDEGADTLTRTDTTNFVTMGVEVDDVVRVSWRGTTYDIAILTVAATVLTLDTTNVISEDLAGVTYDIIRNPAQWIFSAGTSASTQIGDAGDYLAISADALGSLAGSAGDGVIVNLVNGANDGVLAIAWDGVASTLTVTLGMNVAVPESTYEDIRAAITAMAVVTDLFDAALGGSVGDGSTVAAAGSYVLDGGSDDNQILVDSDLIGSAVPTGKVYVSYRALRLDVSSGAAEANLLSFESEDDLSTRLSPVTTDNPLALGVYFALLNSAGTTVKAIGVDEVSATKPDGTLEAYVSAFDFLAGQDVYCLVPLTQDPAVHQVLQTHIDTASARENKHERIGFISRALPLYAAAVTVASGTAGNTGAGFADGTGSTEAFTSSTDFEAAEVLEGDILVVSTLADDTTLTAVTGTDGPLYGLLIDAVNADDSYTLDIDTTDYEAGDLTLSDSWNSLVDVTFTAYRAGSAITAKSDQVAALEAVGPGIEDRRVFFQWPDQCVADVDGSSTVLDGFYRSAAWAGKVSGTSPSQGFSNLSIAGFTALKHSNGYFTEGQLDNMAGSGMWIDIQEASSGPITCRHQLSTDVSSIQKREASITRTIDYVASFLRLALTKKVGKFTITQQFLDSLATQIQALGRYLVEAQVLKSFSLSSIAPNADAPDTVDITVVITPYFPCNYIALVMQI